MGQTETRVGLVEEDLRSVAMRAPAPIPSGTTNGLRPFELQRSQRGVALTTARVRGLRGGAAANSTPRAPLDDSHTRLQPPQTRRQPRLDAQLQRRVNKGCQHV